MKAPDAGKPLIASGSLAPGTRLNGNYEIETKIASGGMGDVYRGRELEIGLPVAIKVIKPELAANEMIIALFRREAETLGQVRHDAIVQYRGFATDTGLKITYLAMEFVTGESLAHRMQRGPLSLEQTLILARRLASGLEAAHRKNVFHRDISPDNIILPGGDPAQAILIDFGIARNTSVGHTIIGGRFAGKLSFASPEHVGLNGGEIGAASDVYSLALTLAAALLGSPIDMGGDEDEVERKRKVVPPLERIDHRFQPILVRMLAPDPKFRPTMADIARYDREETVVKVVRPVTKRLGLVATGIGAFVLLSAWWSLAPGNGGPSRLGSLDSVDRPTPTAVKALPDEGLDGPARGRASTQDLGTMPNRDATGDGSPSIDRLTTAIGPFPKIPQIPPLSESPIKTSITEQATLSPSISPTPLIASPVAVPAEAPAPVDIPSPKPTETRALDAAPKRDRITETVRPSAQTRRRQRRLSDDSRKTSRQDIKSYRLIDFYNNTTVRPSKQVKSVQGNCFRTLNGVQLNYCN